MKKDDLIPKTPAEAAPIFNQNDALALQPATALRDRIGEAVQAWLTKSNSADTRSNYERDLRQFLAFHKLCHGEWEQLVTIRPSHVAGWRDHLISLGRSNSGVYRKLTVLRSLFSYLKTYGYAGANPAHSDFVDAPHVPRDGKTVAFTPRDCRRLLDAPRVNTPVGLRDRAIFAVLAYSACRVGELVKLRVVDFKTTAGHRVLEIRGKGGKERRVALHPEAVERLEAWLGTMGEVSPSTPLFLAPQTSRGQGRDGFTTNGLTKRSIQKLVERYAEKLRLDPGVTVHSFRVTALTTARERGADIVDLQDFAGHADPRTTQTYIRNRDRLSQSPAYVLKY
jgi:integrase/recombinase XerD